MKRELLNKIDHDGYRAFLYNKENSNEKVKILVWAKNRNNAIQEIKDLYENVEEKNIKELSASEGKKINDENEAKIKMMHKEFEIEWNRHILAFKSLFDKINDWKLGSLLDFDHFFKDEPGIIDTEKKQKKIKK